MVRRFKRFTFLKWPEEASGVLFNRRDMANLVSIFISRHCGRNSVTNLEAPLNVVYTFGWLFAWYALCVCSGSTLKFYLCFWILRRRLKERIYSKYTQYSKRKFALVEVTPLLLNSRDTSLTMPPANPVVLGPSNLG